MNQAQLARGLWSLDELTSSDAHNLLATARVLKQTQGSGTPLKGKHVALLCERPLRASADVFSAAAHGLGARVTRIRTNAARLGEAGELDHTARVLGRLYDAIECDGMGLAFMLALARAAAVPVFNVLVHDRHPTRLLADVMTMQEINPGPLGALALHVMGGARAPWGAAWRHMAGVTGIDVAAGTRRAPPPEPPRVAFVCDPRGPRCSDGQPALRVVRGEDGQAVSLAERQVINHRFVVQALLTHTIS